VLWSRWGKRSTRLVDRGGSTRLRSRLQHSSLISLVNSNSLFSRLLLCHVPHIVHHLLLQDTHDIPHRRRESDSGSLQLLLVVRLPAEASGDGVAGHVLDNEALHIVGGRRWTRHAADSHWLSRQFVQLAVVLLLRTAALAWAPKQRLMVSWSSVRARLAGTNDLDGWRCTGMVGCLASRWSRSVSVDEL
jgi:hypothetical protein